MAKLEEVKLERGTAGGNFNVRSDAKFTLKSFFHTWSLENFSKCLPFDDASVFSPTFEFENTSWRLVMHAISENHELKELTIRPCKVIRNGITHYLRYKISVCDDKRGPLATKTAESRLETKSYGRRISFKFDGDEKEALKSVLENDKLVLHCEFLLLSAIPCDQKNVKQVPSKNPVKKNVPLAKPTTILPGNSRFSFNKVNMKRTDSEKLHLIIFVLLLLPAVCIIAHVAQMQEKTDVKHINGLIIDTTLKVYDIAEAFNFTEVKIKSLELLSSYHKLYEDSDSFKVVPQQYFRAISSKLKNDISAEEAL